MDSSEDPPPGSLVTGVIIQKEKGAKTGLHLELHHGRIYVSRLTDSIKKNPVNRIRVGDELFELQGKTVDQYKGIKEIRRVMEEEFARDKKVAVLVQRPDPDASSVSTDSDFEPERSDDEAQYQEYDRPTATKKKPSTNTTTSIEVGETYQLRKLNKKELNGSIVQALEAEPGGERWRVEVLETRNGENENQVISVASEKLFRIIKVGDTMKLKNSKADNAELNGQYVKVKELISKANARWLVDILEINKEVSVAAKNLEFV